MGSDGTIYFSGGGLNAVAPNGAKLWNVPVGDLSPTIDTQGNIYVGSAGYTAFYAISSDGKQKWVQGFQAPPSDSACVGSDGTILFSAALLYALSPQGTNVWSASGMLDGSPVIGLGGGVYLGAYQSHNLDAFTVGGQFSWEAPLGTGSRLPSTVPAVDAAGNIYWCAGSAITAVSPKGSVLWSIHAPPPSDPTQAGDWAITSPTIGADGTIYATLGPTLYAIASGTNGPARSSWPMYRANAQHTGSLQRPVLKQPQRRSDANFQFQIYSQQAGLTYDIQMSTNLTSWTSLTSIVATTLPTDVIDLSASNAPLRFYRAVSPP